MTGNFVSKRIYQALKASNCDFILSFLGRLQQFSSRFIKCFGCSQIDLRSDKDIVQLAERIVESIL